MRFATTLPFDFDPFNEIAHVARRIERTFTAQNSGSSAYDIVRVDGERTELRLAVAGYDLSELDIHVERGILTVAGAKKQNGADVSFIRRGIAGGAAFERRFELAEHVTVEDATLVNGILSVKLRAEVPASDRRKIEINSAA